MDELLPVLRNILTPQGGWETEFFLRVIFSVLLLYLLVVFVARTFGARTFASFTSFDFLINVAAGSLVASAIMGRNLVEGALALLCLAVLQWATSLLSARSRRFHDLVDNPPVVLIEYGQYREEAMRRVRVSKQSLEQQLRSQGVTEVAQVRLAVLESGGSVSVVQGTEQERPATFPRRAG
ncbi:Protein of unknown function [Deinococcus reticulitermitis]|uniref:YetF C-terminal domain-containing protein n=1 Tax=Deinococcus reticulitermitis TaxID=856736 RepID=A0A1H7CZ70_9DEIO|nr:YetF domain-containing protein [Deinococcus reticulitermitis]SEJ94464.1 Protein of unknown function [Deinococcus reticulitermitis]